MHLLLDLQILQSRSRDDDAGRQARGLAAALLKGAPGDETSVLLNLAAEDFDAARRWVDEHGSGARLCAFHGLRGEGEATEARASLSAALYDAYVASLGVDLVLAPPFDGFDRGEAPVAAGAPARAATIYDRDLFDGLDSNADPVRQARARRQLAALAETDLLLTVSDHVSRVVVDRLGIAPECVVNIGFDADPVAQSLDEQAAWTHAASRAREAFARAIARRRSTSPSRPQRRRFVVVPPLDLASFRLAPVRTAMNALARAGDVVLAAPFKVARAIGPSGAVVDPESIGASGNQHVVIAAAVEPDATQRTVLARTPAVVLLLDPAQPKSPSPEALYHAGGYAALRSGNAGPSRDALAAWPNVLGVVDGTGELVERIDAIHATRPLARVPELLERLDSIEQDRDAVAAAIADNHAAPGAPRLLVDLSELAVRGDAKSGIQRVVRGILQHLLIEPLGPRVEPIYRDGDIYRYARGFTCRFLGLEPLRLGDAVVDFRPSDVFVGLDLDATISPAAVRLLKFHSRRGMRLAFVAYDMLPVFRPDWFPEGISVPFKAWIKTVAELADRLVAISRATANDAMTVMERLQPARCRPLEMTWWHLGSDLAGSMPSSGMEPVHAATLARLRGRVIFLAVGTLEPRKGVEQLLDAAEELWREQDIAVVLIGKNGWRVDRLVSRIEQHTELGSRLFWFDSVSDELLERLYAMATALVVPSEAEGFGLPMVEAARHGTPVIARNLDVFREVAGEGAFYFDAESGSGLASALRAWLALHAKQEAPDPRRVATPTWRASTARFLEAVLRPDPYRSWEPK